MRYWFLLFISCSLHAETVLHPASEPLPSGWQQYVIQDLAPLDWVVLDIPKSEARATRQRNHVYKDVRGHFAADVTTTPDDTYYPEQWHLNAMGVPEMWSITQGENVTIAMLDSGIDPNQPDLAGNILFEQGYDFGDDDALPYDTLGHGTQMAGLMVANCGNQIGICGIAPKAKLIPYKLNTQDADGFGQSSFSSADLAAAILAATATDADIISMSLVLPESVPWVEQALQYAKSVGKILVAATGNEGNEKVSFPASLPWVLGIGAHDENNEPLFKSNYGDGLDLLAPGTDLWTTQAGQQYTNFTVGTSAATAITAGLLALLKAEQIEASAPEILAKLLNASLDLSELGYDLNTGFGKARLPVVAKIIHSADAPQLTYDSKSSNVYHYYDRFVVYLASSQLQGYSGNVFFRFNFPITAQGQRTHLFSVWQRPDSVISVPYNADAPEPNLFEHELNLFLFGAQDALFGDGLISTQLIEGAYELLAYATYDSKQLITARKIMWLSQNLLEKNID
ncbi:S8 family serine peptidase [Candidatus Albibeggiatoa sp. nov. NOAA]|uniref:S8 family peptidase n=1 Tax=Candidatus Albibeggiatoa sp. nov. NOAA TaxID=3162724 RepID=UPI0032F2A758|nr:S8 family serine peptidase [Thiotrichaceae bacterium]